MKKKSRIIFSLLFLVVLTSLSFTLARYSTTIGYDIVLVSSDPPTKPTETEPTEEPDPEKIDVKESLVDQGEFNQIAQGLGTANATAVKEVAIAEDGIYLIQLWGGNGGPPSYGPAHMSKPGLGGYIVAIGFFNAGDKLTIQLGQFGFQSKVPDANVSDAGSGGTQGGGFVPDGNSAEIGYAGGGSSKIEITRKNGEKKVAMIAGGGGGAGYRIYESYDGGNGGSMADTPAQKIDSGTGDTIYVYKGNDGKTWKGQVGRAGDQSSNQGQSTTGAKGGGGGGGYRGGGAGEEGGGGGGSSMVNQSAGLDVGTMESKLMKQLAKGSIDLGRPPANVKDELYHGEYRIIKLTTTATYDEIKAAFQ